MCFTRRNENIERAREELGERMQEPEERTGPWTRTVPPANQELDREETEKAKERLHALVGR